MDLIILMGLQGSGKSTFYRTRFGSTHQIVSKDLMPNQRHREVQQRRRVQQALNTGVSVVVDNTNATAKDREELIALGHAHCARVIGYYFQSELGDCLRRNRQRTGKERVPDVALFVTAKILQAPSFAEGFDELYSVRLKDDSDFEVSPWGN